MTQANVVAHPAKLTIPQEIEAIKTPTLWICAEVDQSFGTEDRKKTEEILKQSGKHAVFKDYAGTTHGFAARGDPNNPVVQKAMINASEETVKFFMETLK